MAESKILITITLAELKAMCPSVSVQLIKKVLAQMKAEGKVSLTGKGRGARWERLQDARRGALKKRNPQKE